MTPKILIVDDEPLNLATLEAFLSGEDYELHFATDGHEACAKAQVVHPDLILLDVMMPGLDGFTVTRHIRADSVIGRVPIILVTALDDDRSRIEGLRAGADDFLTKPCRREEIRARVRTVASLNRFRAIAEQRERFARLFDLAPAAIVLVDGRGLVLSANAHAAAHRVGDSLYAPFGPASAASLRAAVAAALAGEPQDLRNIRLGDGPAQRILHVRVSTVPEGDAQLALLAFEDVTEEVRAREAVEKMNAELEDLVRARTRQLEESNGLLMSYASFVSHDLRSPLTAVKGYLSMLHEGVVPVGDEAAPMVAQAFNAAVMMQELIENILQLAQDEHDRPAQGRVLATDPAPTVRRLASRMRELFPQPPPKIEVADLPLVGVSAVLIERVFYNLLANALKYSSQRPMPHVQVGSRAMPEGPVLFVRDNGVGFDARDADKLFREFSRLSTASGTEGFGLGLSLVARLVRAHGGRIWAESTTGAGATFFVQLPPPATPAEIAAVSPPPAAPPADWLE